jgi:SNF2 family DNA or RNA helicase
MSVIIICKVLSGFFMYEVILNENGHLHFEPLPQASMPTDSKLKKHVKESYPKALFYLATQKKKNYSFSLKFWSDFAGHFIEAARLDPSIEELREKSQILLKKEPIRKLLNESPFMLGSEYLNEDYLQLQWRKLHQYFSSEIKSFNGSVEEYFAGLNPEIHLAGRVFFHLVENKDDTEYPFAFMATYLADVKERENPTHRPLRYALEEYKNDQKKMLLLLATIKRTANASELIKNLLDSGEIFDPLKWTAHEAQNFLEETPLYNQAGVLCRIPNWWRSQSKGFQVNFKIGEKKSSHFGKDSLVNFNANLSLGGEALTEKEIGQLLGQSSGLALLKGKWVKFDKNNLSNALEKWREAKELMHNHGISFHQAMKMLGGLNPDITGLEVEDTEVTRGKWLDGIIDKLKNPELTKNIAVSRKFKGTLRPYQHHGLNWINTLHSLNLGGCLADDMGLGKTIQVLAFLQRIIDKDDGLHLLAVPASLLSNWASEIQKFTPKLKYLIAHPSNQEFKKIKNITQTSFKNYNLIITTYGLVRRSKWCKEINWSYLILDEAQAIKNPGTSQTKAIKALKSKNRLALTGTPIENHPGDLWSLFDFINPGLLGSRSEFQTLTKNLAEDGKGMGKLKSIISPYILRRLKTDKKIITDLPDKIELKSYSHLSKKQAVEYQALVTHIQNSLLESSGIQRKGLILSSLSKFKQICNHSDQYLGTGGYNLIDSGKFELLKEIAETIFEKREKVLIFTQFKEIIIPLNSLLSELSGKKGLILHGGTSIKKRKEAVEKFQSNEYIPYFILSLKAGGTGLNLTAANHVIHFDRWWNPAVENQATDRAFRIGQKKKVIVHKFVTKGTLEEKIDQMIEEKAILASDIIGKGGEIKLTEMKNDEIMNLIKMDQGF